MVKKIATFIAAIAIAVAFTMPAFAESLVVDNTTFHGDVYRGDALTGHADLGGSLLGTTGGSNPFVVHLIDGYHDIWCTALAGAVTDSLPMNGTGSVSVNVGKLSCVDQNHNNAYIAGTGTITFATSLWQAADTYQPAVMSLQAKTINVSFPSSPNCMYKSFTGIGSINNPS